MTTRRTIAGIFIATALMWPASSGAHRLDEYLQATLVGIEVSRVNLEIDLTPGISIAKQVTGWIDTNGDGELSTAEGVAYANEVVSSLALTVDRQSLNLTIRDVRLPAVTEMAAGVGTIRLLASAGIPKGMNGRHELKLVNTHRPEASIYLSNALAPSDSRIQIATQQRDRDQHSLTINYDIETAGALRRISWVTGALGLLGMAAVIRGGIGRFRPRQARPV